MRQNIAIIAFGLAFLFLLGTAGGLEAGNFSFKTAVLYGLVALAVMAGAVIIGRLYEYTGD